MEKNNADILGQVLNTIRLRGSIFFCSKLSAPWGMTLTTADHPRFHFVLEGHCYFQSSDMDEPVALKTGDFVLITHGSGHWIADSPHSERIASDTAAKAYARGEQIFQDGETVTRLLCGRFLFDRHNRHPLISTLPSCIQIANIDKTKRHWLHQTALLIEHELQQSGAGIGVVVDRICEALFVQILRSSNSLKDQHTGFLSALQDPVLNRALQAIHSQLSHEWTVEELAVQCNLSRSAFASRFQQKVGLAPIAYLTLWRMQNALCLLRDTPLSMAQIADHLGYSSDMALSKAFKRFYGETPGTLRKSMRQALLSNNKT